MRTFLIVLDRQAANSRTFTLCIGARWRLSGSEAKQKAEQVARSLGVNVKEKNLAWTPKVIGGVRIYVAVY